MGRKERSGGAVGRLEALLALGDLRAARAEAGRLLDDPGAPAPDREAAAAALARTRPEPGAAAAAAVGLVLFLAVALLGLLRHR